MSKLTNQSNSTQDTEDVVADDEDRAWTWLESKWLNVEAGHDPNDRDYSADEMVDAYMAGRQSLSDRIDGLTRAPTDAMIEAGKGAWLDKRGFSDRDVLVAIYTAMTRAALHQEGIAP